MGTTLQSSDTTELVQEVSSVERGPKMRLSLLLLSVVLAVLAVLVSAREPKVIDITLDGCMGTPAPVNASTRPLELRDSSRSAAPSFIDVDKMDQTLGDRMANPASQEEGLLW